MSEQASVNPYATPRSALVEEGPQYEPVKVFSITGRIGRARYLAYGVGLYLLFIALGAGLSVMIGPIGTAIGFGAALVVTYMLTMQRCHDFNTTGWLALVMFVPLANLIFWIIPGTDGPNRFGKPTPPNSVLTLILVWLLPAIAVIGIIAAIALPAYQQYVKRAQQQTQPR